jgi:hypothetical protein
VSYESRAYDNEHGNPVVILVATGTHDVSRLVNLLAGSRMALCEHHDLSGRIRRQVNRRNGGRAALKMPAEHGGPVLLEGPSRPSTEDEETIRMQIAKEIAARGEKLMAEAVEQVRSGEPSGFSATMRAAAISWTAKFVRGEVS